MYHNESCRSQHLLKKGFGPFLPPRIFSTRTQQENTLGHPRSGLTGGKKRRGSRVAVGAPQAGGENRERKRKRQKEKE